MLELDPEFIATKASTVHVGYTEKESTDLDEETEAKSRHKGYSVQEIQHYVRQVTGQPLQLNLKHLEKNRHIKKWVYISFDNKRPIMYDHDDQVISLTLDRTISGVARSTGL